MKPTSIIRSLVIIFFSQVCSVAYAQMDPETIIAKVIEKKRNATSLNYDIHFLHKSFSRDDTFKLNAHVELVRVPDDSLFHGLVLIKMDTVWYGYDGEKVFQRNLRTNEVLYDNAATSPGLFILGHVRKNLIDDGFLINRTSLLDVYKDPKYQCRFSDEFIGRPCLGMYFKLPDEEEMTNQFVYGAIDTAEHVIIKKSYSTYFQDNEQYQEWNYYNVQFGQDSMIPELDWATYGPSLKEKQYFRPHIDDNQVPDVDWLSIEGKLFNSDERVILKKVNAPFIILDFWYTSCYPCIKSIPMVRNIANKYNRKDVAIFGANMIDNEIKNKSRLDKFFLNNPMPYPTIMLNNDRYSHLNLSYPTFVILNDRFEVVYYESGYDENLESEVTQYIDSHL